MAHAEKDTSIAFADLIASTDPGNSTEARVVGKRMILDFLASSVHGREDPGVMRFVQQLRKKHNVDSNSTQAIWRSEELGSVADIALVNGFQAHSIDFDDIHPEVRGHPGSVILSALFAASNQDTKGRDFLDALIVGVEVMVRIGRGLNPSHYLNGWHSTSTIGTIAAAAAVSRLWHSSVEHTATAVSLAFSRAAGVRLQFGTDAKPLQVGLAARAGIESAAWAKAGITANTGIFSTAGGVSQVFGGELSPTTLLNNWADPWAAVDPGLWFKRFPFCGAALTPADCLLAISEEVPLSPREVQFIEVFFPPGGDAALVHTHPNTGIEGRFSVEYIFSLIVHQCSLGPRAFGNDPIEPRHLQFLHKVRRRTLPSLEWTGISRPTITRVTQRDGTVYERFAEFPKGSRTNPLSLEDQLEKLDSALPPQILASQCWERIESAEDSTMEQLLMWLRLAADEVSGV